MIGLGLRLVGKGNWKDREVGNIDAEKTLQLNDIPFENENLERAFQLKNFQFPFPTTHMH